jgi:hypothetical protein
MLGGQPGLQEYWTLSTKNGARIRQREIFSLPCLSPALTRTEPSTAMKVSSSQFEEIVGEVRQTVLHELGHYFGLGEEDMPEEEA